jgi:hypothetical protein
VSAAPAAAQRKTAGFSRSTQKQHKKKGWKNSNPQVARQATGLWLTCVSAEPQYRYIVYILCFLCSPCVLYAVLCPTIYSFGRMASTTFCVTIPRFPQDISSDAFLSHSNTIYGAMHKKRDIVVGCVISDAGRKSSPASRNCHVAVADRKALWQPLTPSCPNGSTQDQTQWRARGRCRDSNRAGNCAYCLI